jgi:uncharacterized LabA/DUF88 family protein
MQRLGIFVDVGDQFFRINKKWEGEKLDYQKYYDKCKEFGEVVRAIAYGTQINKNATKFISCLHHIGFEPKYREMETGQWYNWSVGISIDIMNLVNHDKVDTVVIGLSIKDIVPLVNCIKDKGIKVVVMSCSIHKELRDICDHWIEISEDMLSDKNNITEAENISENSA